MEVSLKEIIDLVGTKENKTFLKKSKCYLVRTVTFTIAGTFEDYNEHEFLFSNCDWIADTGRFHDSLKSCAFNEVEPFINSVIVNRNSFVDITEINSTPRVQK